MENTVSRALRAEAELCRVRVSELEGKAYYSSVSTRAFLTGMAYRLEQVADQVTRLLNPKPEPVEALPKHEQLLLLAETLHVLSGDLLDLHTDDAGLAISNLVANASELVRVWSVDESIPF